MFLLKLIGYVVVFFVAAFVVVPMLAAIFLA